MNAKKPALAADDAPNASVTDIDSGSPAPEEATPAGPEPLIYCWHDNTLKGLLISGDRLGMLLSQTRHMVRGARVVITLAQHALEREQFGETPALSVDDRESLNLAMIASLSEFDELIDKTVEWFKIHGVPEPDKAAA